jgi:hypothetical protein
MMSDGVQTITSSRLKDTLKSAREQMPEVLAYAKFSVSEFIERVESRSSLLIMSGHEIEKGTLYPTYEFRHLTFQEYLAAVAITEGYYPNRKDDDTILTVLRPYIENRNWKEVIPLTAVLAGRSVEPLITYLTERTESSETFDRGRHITEREEASPFSSLTQCIIDEVNITPDLLEKGLELIGRRIEAPFSVAIDIYESKYGNVFERIVCDNFIKADKDIARLAGVIADITFVQINWDMERGLTRSIYDNILELSNDKETLNNAKGALALMYIAYIYEAQRFGLEIDAVVGDYSIALADKIVEFLYSKEPYLYFSSSWACVWLGKAELWSPERDPVVLSRLFEIWESSPTTDIGNMSAWAIGSLPLIDRNKKPLPEPSKNSIEFIVKQSSSPVTESWHGINLRVASYVMSFYWGKPWSDEELSKFVGELYGRTVGGFEEAISISLLKALGEAGKAELEKLPKPDEDVKILRQFK